MRKTDAKHKRYTENRTKDSLGKEKVGDKMGKNKPGRMERNATRMEGGPGYNGGMKGTMKRTHTRRKAY